MWWTNTLRTSAEDLAPWPRTSLPQFRVSFLVSYPICCSLVSMPDSARPSALQDCSNPVQSSVRHFCLAAAIPPDGSVNVNPCSRKHNSQTKFFYRLLQDHPFGCITCSQVRPMHLVWPVALTRGLDQPCLSLSREDTNGKHPEKRSSGFSTPALEARCSSTT